MLAGAELERLRLKKELLVLQADASRMALTAEMQRLRSPELWLGGAGHAVRKHPLLTSALAVAAGIFAIRALRQPGVAMNWLDRLGGVGPAMLSLWNLIGRK